MEWPVDMVMVDAHYGYYADRTILEELHEGVFRPARTCGYRRIWIGGISLGGFGALLYASRYPEDVTMAPFVGHPHLIDEIASAGGLSRWTGGRKRRRKTIRDNCGNGYAGP
jgi:pimeloyl-ACP methyl ester carboxylesterase